jgi:hypothetical protein
MKITALILMLVSGIVFSAIEPIYISEGDFYNATIHSSFYNPIYVSGGYVYGITVNESTAECYISGGSIGSMAVAGGYTEISGGNITYTISYSDNANLKISGGNIDSIELGTRFWPNLNKINIDCYSYDFYDMRMAPMGDSEGLISAKLDIVLADGTAQIIAMDYTDPIAGMQTPEYFFNFNIIPEPATLALLGLGGFFLRKRGFTDNFHLASNSPCIGLPEPEIEGTAESIYINNGDIYNLLTASSYNPILGGYVWKAILHVL